MDDESAAEPVTIPGTVFSNIGGVRAIGVAGLARANPEEFESVVTEFSMMVAGQMEFFPVAIVP